MSKLDGFNQPDKTPRPVTSRADDSSDAVQNTEKAASGNWRPTWSSKLLVSLLIVVSVVLLITLSAAIVVKKSNNRLVKQDAYQAVFLNNGQVYFGKLHNINRDYVILTDIYYLQVNQQVQPEQGDNEQQQPQVTLTKLGNELHGPEDAMFIDRDKIVFWENLKNDSQVVQKIGEEKSQ